MINAVDINVWRDEFEQYASKVKKVFNLERGDDGLYKSSETQELWLAWVEACISQMERFIRSLV